MKIFRKMAALAVLAIVTAACDKEEKLQAEPDLPVAFDTSTALGQKQQELYDKYDVRFDYQWNRYAFARNAVADPANVEDVLPYMEIMDELFFKAMGAVSTREDFVTGESPLTIFLLGSGINYAGDEEFGEGTVGQAGNIQPNRLTLGGLNEFGELLRTPDADDEFLDMIYNQSLSSFPGEAGLIGFMYHEYTHFVDSKHQIPVGFEQPSKEFYLRGTNGFLQVNDSTARAQGFFIPYGMQNEHEDFATFVQIMVWKTPAEIETEYLTGNEAAKKYKLVEDYYAGLGLPLDALRNYLNQDEVKEKILAIKHQYED